MKPALIIEPKEWMQEPAITAVMDALGAKSAMLVGGAVRAALLNEEVGDIDIATVHTPDDVIKRMSAINVKTIPTGIDHGTVTAVIGKQHFEITTLRQDVMTDGRHAEVAFSKDWVEDAKRRDFTINTLLMDLHGHVYDPTHQGVADLQKGLVRFVGNPGRRINEDYLRILRFFRFHARYGKGRPDLEGVRAAIRASGHIATLSRERIVHEYERLLPARGAGEVLEQLRDYDILPGVISPALDHGKYRILQKLVAGRPAQADIKLLFAYSVWQNKADTLFEVLEKSFVLSNALKNFLTKNIQFVNMQPAALTTNLFHFGRDITQSGSVLYEILNQKNPSLAKLEKLLDTIGATSVPVFPINGNDVAQFLGIMPGRQMGNILKDVERWWLEKDAKPNRQQVLDHVRAMESRPIPDPDPEEPDEGKES